MKSALHIQEGERVRQGDVFLLKIGDASQPVPTNSEILEGGILARGEVTGHAHTVNIGETMLSTSDLLFLEEIQCKLSAPLVYKDEVTRVINRGNMDGVPLQSHFIAKIHAPQPFILAHVEESVGVVPTEEEASVRDLHSAILMPAGLYLAEQQVEHDESDQMKPVID